VASPRPGSILRLLEDALVAHDERLRELTARAAADGDVDLVHDVRVALRRLEALARVFRGVPAEGDGGPARHAARELRRRLTLLRSEEVGRALLSARPEASAAGLEALVFPGELPALRVAPEDVLPVSRSVATWKRSLAAAAAGAFAPRAGMETLLARATLRRLRRRSEELADLLPPGRRSLHAARIAAKRLRYALEVVEPLDPGVRPLLRLLRSFQDAAGDAHDLLELAGRARAAGGAELGPALRALLLQLDADADRAVAAARRRGEALVRPVRRLRPALAAGTR
jgi:CHAD domain-containing protein